MENTTATNPLIRIRALLAATLVGLLVATLTPGSNWNAAIASEPTRAQAPALGQVDVIVQAVPQRLSEAMEAVARSGGEVLRPLPIIDGFVARVSSAAAATLSGSSAAIRAVTPDGPVAFQATTSGGDDAPDSSYVETVGADRLHRAGYDGSGVGIAIIDTGVSEVADLSGRVVGGADLTAEGDGVDRFGHGTFLAGIAAGDGASSNGEHAGVAPGAHVVPVKIAGENGAADVSHVLAALQWVVSFKDEYGIEVLNLSFGTNSSQSYLIDPLNYAVEKAWDAGIVVVVAAANDGPEASTVMKPADDPMVITVGATDSNGTVDRGDDEVTSFSSRGPTRADGLHKPDLVAPGAHIVGLRSPGSTVDTEHPEARVGEHYFRGSGTSFAAAVTSGTVALLKQIHPEWTPDDVKGALFGMAADGPVGDVNVDGKGALDVRWTKKIDTPGFSQNGKVRGDGSGSLEGSRGSLAIEIEKDLLGTLTGTVTSLLSGETTAQDQIFNGVEYTTMEWTGAHWYESQWHGAHWYGAHWYGAHWYGAHWYGAHWY